MDVQIGSWGNIHLLWLVVAVAAVMLVASFQAGRALKRFATPNMIDRIFLRQANWVRVVVGVLGVVVMGLLTVCLIDLRWGKVQREVPQKGIEVIFVLDVSRSMLAQDVSPNRLKRAKQMIADTLEQMAGDRVGLTVFAGEARRQIPLTSHYDDFKRSLDEVGPHNVSRGGSRLGEAIEVAARGFLSKTNEHKAIVLLTDGEDQESKPVQIAKQIHEESGVRIFTIGLGDLSEGARIPLQETGGFLKHQGQPVWSKLNGKVLTEVATATGGAYIPAGTKQVNMADIYHRYIANVSQQEFASAKISSYEARYQYFLLPALMLLIAQIALGRMHKN